MTNQHSQLDLEAGDARSIEVYGFASWAATYLCFGESFFDLTPTIIRPIFICCCWEILKSL
jgi:hypothetical protein